MYRTESIGEDAAGETDFEALSFSWVREHNKLPFFLFVHTYQTHSPYRPAGRFDTMFDTEYAGPVGKTPEMCYPRNVQSDPDKVHIEALYDGEIAYTDEVVGDFLTELQQMRLLDNTVVIIFSDHGEEVWEHGGFGHGDTLYEEVLQVPLVIRLPGERPPKPRFLALPGSRGRGMLWYARVVCGQ